jgi:hypothetical protein
MPVAGGPKLTTTGILLEVDAADKTSYSGTGTTWTNHVRPGTFNGTLNNISFNSTDAKGALVFTGSNTFVDFGNLGPSLTSSFSFQVAFKPAATASGQPYTILSYASASATSSLTFKLDYTSSNQTVVLTTFAGTGSQNIVYAISASAASGSWNIVHGTFGSSLAALYVNGLGQAYAPTTGSVVGYNTANRLYAGLNFGSTVGYFTGSVANITVNNADLDGLSVNRNYNAIATRFSLPFRRPTVTDADALAFIETAGISGETQQTAINTLVLGLKANSLWTKMVSIYPLIGGSAFSHKYNLKNINTHPVVWFGSISHTSNGVELGNGGYGSVPTLNINTLEQNNTSFSVYNKTTLTWPSPTQRYLIGSTAGHAHFGTGFRDAFGGFQYSGVFNGTEFGYRDNTLGLPGYTVVSRINSGNFQIYFNSTELYNASTTSITPISSTFEIGRAGVGYVGTTPQTSAFVTVGQGLSQSETTTLTNLVQAFQTTLGRQA